MLKSIVSKILFLGICIVSTSCFSQQYIEGVLKSRLTDKPISGVNIVEEGSNNRTITNEDGEFSLFIKTLPTTIVVSHTAFKSGKIVVKDLKTIDIALDSAVIFLPETQVYANVALNILQSVVNKSISDSSSTSYYRAFYQKASRFKGEYTKLHEMFLNVSWGSFGVREWQPTNVRFAVTERQKYTNSNFAIFCFMTSRLVNKQVYFPLNEISLIQNYTYKLKHYINFGQDNEIAIIEVIPKNVESVVKFKGNILINTKTNNVVQVDGMYIYPINKGWNRVCKVNINYRENKTGFAVLDNLYIEESSSKLMKKNTERGWLYFYEEIPAFEKVKTYPGFVQNDLIVLENSNYDAKDWGQNIPIKHTKLEKEVIDYFEKNKKFNSNMEK